MDLTMYFKSKQSKTMLLKILSNLYAYFLFTQNTFKFLLFKNLSWSKLNCILPWCWHSPAHFYYHYYFNLETGT